MINCRNIENHIDSSKTKYHHAVMRRRKVVCAHWIFNGRIVLIRYHQNFNHSMQIPQTPVCIRLLPTSDVGKCRIYLPIIRLSACQQKCFNNFAPPAIRRDPLHVSDDQGLIGVEVPGKHAPMMLSPPAWHWIYLRSKQFGICFERMQSIWVPLIMILEGGSTATKRCRILMSRFMCRRHC